MQRIYTRPWTDCKDVNVCGCKEQISTGYLTGFHLTCVCTTESRLNPARIIGKSRFNRSSRFCATPLCRKSSQVVGPDQVDPVGELTWAGLPCLFPLFLRLSVSMFLRCSVDSSNYPSLSPFCLSSSLQDSNQDREEAGKEEDNDQQCWDATVRPAAHPLPSPSSHSLQAIPPLNTHTCIVYIKHWQCVTSAGF